jgi:hypothetical protein
VVNPANVGDGWWRTVHEMWTPVLALHKVVTVANAACLAGALLFFLPMISPVPMDWVRPFGLAYVVGYFANAAALLISLLASVYTLLKLVQGQGHEAWRRHWLGVVNGLAVVLAWSPLWGHAVYRSMMEGM